MGHAPSVILLLIIVLFSILLQYYCYGSSVVDGAREVELEKQLKILNKPPIKSIRTRVGDVFDCIDINKQPSFDHPFLKNHVIKTRPISHSINTMGIDDHEPVSSSSSSPANSSMKLLSRITILRKLDCPDGTVPIRRTSKGDLLRAKLFSESQLVHYSNIGERDDLKDPDEGQFLSIAKTKKDSGIEYIGIAAHINTYNPPVTDDQMSTAQLWIENDYEEEFNSLQAGWMVAPSLYGDNKTRLFGKWKIDGSDKSEGCYNILCPGFVQVDKDHPIDGTVDRISQFGIGTKQYDIKVAIYQDDGGNWWLDLDDIKIGYWPAELELNQLATGSSLIAWGGLATQLRPETTIVPPTGNGHWPQSRFNYQRQCYMRQMKVIPTKSETENWEDPDKKIIDIFATEELCSNMIYYGRLEDLFQHTLAFGGPGGNCTF